MASLVNGAGDQFLARAGLAFDEYGTVRLGDQVDLLKDFGQRGALAEYLAVRMDFHYLFAKVFVFQF